MEHTPRFDNPDQDPSSLKPDLAKLADVTFGQLWLSSPLKHKIFVGRHSLESSGAGQAHFARYENNKTGRYDGVHLYGKNGCQDYTNSVNSILMLALTDDSQFNNQNGFGTAQRNNHNNCPQAKFQKKPQPNVQTQNRFSVLNSNAGKTCEGWVSPLLVLIVQNLAYQIRTLCNLTAMSVYCESESLKTKKG